jgi:hypothetical protein
VFIKIITLLYLYFLSIYIHSEFLDTQSENIELQQYFVIPEPSPTPNCHPHTQVNIANGSYKINGHSVDFYYSPYSDGSVASCPDEGLCGTGEHPSFNPSSGGSNSYGGHCASDNEEEYYYHPMFIVRDNENKVVFQAIDGIVTDENHTVDKENKVDFDSIDVRKDPSSDKIFINDSKVQLERTPVDFPYLVIRAGGNISRFSNDTLYLFSTNGEFKLVSEIILGLQDKGFYVDKDGNFLIDIHTYRFSTGGHNHTPSLDQYYYGVTYRLIENEVAINKDGKEQEISRRFVIDVSAMKDKLTIYSQFDIQKLFENARAMNLLIARDLTSGNPIFTHITEEVISTVLSDPLYIFGRGYLTARNEDGDENAFNDLFRLIRNGRVDLAMQYFNLMVPDEYEQNSALLPKELNSKQKLWIAFIDDLKEGTKHLIPGVTDWRDSEPLWPLYEQFNGGSIPRELYK